MKPPHMMRTPPAAVALLGIVLLGCGTGGGDDATASASTASAVGGSMSWAGRVPETPAGELLARSLAHHDPQATWLQRPIYLQWVSSQPDADERVAELTIDNALGVFDLAMEHRGHDLDYRVEGDALDVRVDGSSEISPTLRETVSLHREGGLMWRNYFIFLAGLPMKLTDDGATLADETVSTEFQGQAVDAIEVTYETDDGYPHWAFYFDPVSAALVGARFWRDAPDGDGEYIAMEGEVEAGTLRIPARRHWHMNADDAFLGTDEVRGLEVGR